MPTISCTVSFRHTRFDRIVILKPTTTEVIEDFHKKYNADIVRTGPRELSVATADAIPLIYGPLSKCRKGVWYSGAYHIEGASLQTTRDFQDHKERRKTWDRAFNAKSLREYEPRVNRHTRLLIDKLKEHAQDPSVRISSWIGFFAFDVMGDIGYNRGFGMLEKGQEDEMIELVHKSMANMSTFAHIPWVIGMMLRTSVGAKDLLTFMGLVQDVLVERKKVSPHHPNPLPC